MVKPEEDVVHDFNEYVNMTADEIETFLKTDDSTGAGWGKEDGSGESVGHESGRKIVDILKRNPDKDASKYTEEDIDHMRKVVAYCKRHLAQEGHMKEEKSEEELKQTKSYKSLKNWGHDPLKKSNGSSGSGSTEKPKSSGKPASKKAPAKPKSSGKPASKKAAPAEEKKDEAEKGEEKAEKAEDAKAEDKAEKKDDKAEEKKGDKADGDKKEETAETGDKREAPAADKEEKKAKPASKKAKTEKVPTEPSRKPPSRGVKKG